MEPRTECELILLRSDYPKSSAEAAEFRAKFDAAKAAYDAEQEALDYAARLKLLDSLAVDVRFVAKCKSMGEKLQMARLRELLEKMMEATK